MIKFVRGHQCESVGDEEQNTFLMRENLRKQSFCQENYLHITENNVICFSQ